MTSPQDPNQPADPGAAGPAEPAPQGWGQPPQGPAPWGAPPAPTQPGWGAPPADAGWGTPPPAAGQPGWGAPPPAGGQPGWGQPPAGGWGAPPKKKGHGCLIAFLIVLGLVVLVGGCTVLVAGPYITTTIKLYGDLGTDRVSNVSIDNSNGATSWVIHLKAGHDSQTEADELACQIVLPDLAGTQF